MPDASAFSPDYAAARARFRSSALALGCRTTEHPIEARGPDGEALTIDAAVLGAERPERAVVVSSGLHGVEGFFGSAVQAAVLEELLGGFRPPDGVAIVLLHALNPFGFAWLRRVNEDNVDLNRSFLLAGEAYAGAPEGYAPLDGLLNPRTPPPPLDPFLPVAVWQIARHGLPALKDAVAGGQYAFPQGLFFGGAAPSATQRVLTEVLPRLVGSARRVLHVDFHTGLGERGRYKLFVDHPRDGAGYAELARWFGADVVEPWAADATAYRIRGGLGTWSRGRQEGYDVLAAEFGTERVLTVIRALRRENRAWHWAERTDPRGTAARAALRDVFAPPDARWRDAVVPQGVRIVEQALDAICS